jgi:hypothetical protein
VICYFPLNSWIFPLDHEVTWKQSKHRDLILVQAFWARGTDSIVDIRITDMDTKSYSKRPLDKVLESGKKLKKKKHLEACLEQ